MDNEEDIVEILETRGNKALTRRTKNGKTFMQVLENTKLEHGKPIDPEQDLFTLEPRDGEPRRYDVKTFYESKKGPARTSSPQFREGWDNIFGKKPSKEMLN